jgi:hypothetical protein
MLFSCRRRSIEELRKRFVIDGFEACLEGKPKTHNPPVMHGENQAKPVKHGPARKDWTAPGHWNLRLLKDRFVTIEGTSVSRETIRKALHEARVKAMATRRMARPARKEFRVCRGDGTCD